MTDTRVALKVVKRSEAFHAQAAKELEILKALGGHAGRSIEKNGGNNEMDAGGSKGDGDGRRREGHPNVVSMLDAFVHRGGGGGGGLTDGGFHCLVFELLSHSLYDVLRSTSFKGVSLGLIRKFARQILSALSFLRSRGVVHCDLKPENVLLVSADRSAVKLIDFGSSCLVGDTPDFTYVQSRFYRAAEVILGLPYGSEIDSWSLGCILVEMHAGTPLFPGKDERDQLGKIAEALGPVPRWMCDRCPPEKRSMHYPQRKRSRRSRRSRWSRRKSPAGLRRGFRDGLRDGPGRRGGGPARGVSHPIKVAFVCDAPTRVVKNISGVSTASFNKPSSHKDGSDGLRGSTGSGSVGEVVRRRHELHTAGTGDYELSPEPAQRRRGLPRRHRPHLEEVRGRGSQRHKECSARHRLPGAVRRQGCGHAAKHVRQLRRRGDSRAPTTAPQRPRVRLSIFFGCPVRV